MCSPLVSTISPPWSSGNRPLPLDGDRDTGGSFNSAAPCAMVSPMFGMEASLATVKDLDSSAMALC